MTDNYAKGSLKKNPANHKFQFDFSTSEVEKENENAAKDPILQVPLNPKKILEVFEKTYPPTGSLHFAKGGYGRCLKADKLILDKWFEDNCPISDEDTASDLDKQKIKQYLDRFDTLDPETLRKTSK